jgi:hypothetical protein
MRPTIIRRYVLISCIVLISLAGCGGSQLPIAAPGTMGSYAARATQPDSQALSTTEVLYTRSVKARCFGNSYGCNCVFHAAGKAWGPLIGAFTARGSWNATSNESWKFSETFSIKSSSKIISGTISGQGAHPQMKGGCVSFGPHMMTYSTGGYNGNVRVRFRWHHIMLEHLERLQ